MRNLYVYAGQVFNTHKELGVYLGKSPAGVSALVYRAKKRRAPFYLRTVGITDQLTDDSLWEIRKNTYADYVYVCAYSGQEIKIDPPQGDFEIIRIEKKPPCPYGGIKKHKLYLCTTRWGSNYFIDDEVGPPKPSRAVTVAYQSHQLVRVERARVRECYAKNLWHPGRKTHFKINGNLYPSKIAIARGLGISRNQITTIIKNCHNLKRDWPEGWVECW